MRHPIPDFDEYMLPRARTRLRRTNIYRQYITARRDFSIFLAAHDASGGTRTEPAVLSRVRALEALGETLFTEMRRLQAEEACRPE